MKGIVLLSLLPAFALGQSQVELHHDTTAPKTTITNVMSKAFRDKAYRAVDALNRLPPSPSLDDKGPTFDQKLLDAQKAIDEAKYATSNNRDRQILKKLQASELLSESMVQFDMLDRRWESFDSAGWQCRAELSYAFEPDKLTAQGKATAKEDNCLAKKKEAFEGLQ